MKHNFEIGDSLHRGLLGLHNPLSSRLISFFFISEFDIISDILENPNTMSLFNDIELLLFAN